jgi:curved DNA-binding protein CbpA
MKKQPTPDDIKRQHRALSRLVHPDKNANNPRAADASAALNAAVDVLSDPVKRRLFDLYVQDSESRNDGSSGEAGKSFADWEAETLRPPRWLLRVLSCPGGGVVLAVLSVILLVPALALLLVVALLCLPLRLVLWHCCGVGEPVFQRKGRKREGEEGQQDAGGGGGGETGGGGDIELGGGERKN